MDSPDNDNEEDNSMIPELFRAVTHNCWDACGEHNVFDVLWTSTAALAGFLTVIGEHNKVDRDKICEMWRALCQAHEEPMRTFRASDFPAKFRNYDA